MNRSNSDSFDIESCLLVKSIQSNSNRSQIVEQFYDYVEYENSLGPQ